MSSLFLVRVGLPGAASYHIPSCTYVHPVQDAKIDISPPFHRPSGMDRSDTALSSGFKFHALGNFVARALLTFSHHVVSKVRRKLMLGI